MKAMHEIYTVALNTFELVEGDIVLNHGCLFGLTKRHVAHDHIGPKRDVVWFETTMLHRFNDTIPQSWLPWTIQGNELARWAVVRDAEVVGQFMDVYQPSGYGEEP